jgi:hypothetical protein
MFEQCVDANDLEELLKYEETRSIIENCDTWREMIGNYK